jgi:acetyltransferase
VIATPELYRQALDIVRRDPGVDAALMLYAPSRIAPGEDYARAVIDGAGGSRFNVLTSWMGQASVAASRQALDEAGIPTYDTPDQAVQAFMHMVRHRRNQEYLRETPAAAMTTHEQDREAARQLVARARRSGRDYLDAKEAQQVASAYGIPVAESVHIRRAGDTVKLLDQVGPSLALRIVHEEHCHPFVYGDRLRSSWRGISFDLATPDQVRAATTRMQDWVKNEFPDSRVLGFVAQRMLRGRASQQISAGITHDPVFGPLLVFGVGGRHVNVLADRRIGLPPMNLTLARELIRSSHVHRMLEDGSDNPQLQLHNLAQMLVALSQMAAEIPELRGLEINPLVLNRDGLVAVNVIADLGDPRLLAPMAIRPYPQELCEAVQLPRSKRRVEIRPIRGEDEPAHLEFHNRLSAQSIRFRYFYNRRNFSHQELAQMTQIDYSREMAFIASALQGEGGNAETLGEVRAWRDADNIRAEFSVIVRDDIRGEGLGCLLLEKMISYCRDKGTLEIVGSVLRDNAPMLALADRLGFIANYSEENDVMEMRLQLNRPRQEWQRQRLQQPIN